jgi:PAS domain S-box-containing protein
MEIVDPADGRVLDMNERACRMHGYSREEYRKLRIPDLDPDEGTDPWGAVPNRSARKGSS